MLRELNFRGVEGVQLRQVLTRWLKTDRECTLELRNARRFLFLQYETALGTAVNSTPVYEALRRALPDAEINLVCSGLPYEVLKYNPNIDEIICTPHPLKQWSRAVWFFTRRFLRNRKQHDCVVMDSGNSRSRFALLAFLTGVRMRVGFEFPHDLNHVSIPYDFGKSVLANNLSLIGTLGHAYTYTEPAVFFSDEEVKRVDELLKEMGISEQMPLIAFQTQTSGGEPNQWYDERFIQVAKGCYHSAKAQILFVGTKPECERIDAIRVGLHGPSYSTAGRTDIPTLAALLARCDLLVTLDTGTMHVGRAVRVPMVIIAPAKNPEHQWLPPVSEHIRVLIRKEIKCAKCGKTYCATRECMDEIHADAVLSTALDQLKRFPPSSAARRERTSLRNSSNHPRYNP